MAHNDEFKVVWEIQVSTSSPLEAAKIAQEYQRDPNAMATQFYVQKDGEKEVVSVDLSEEDEDAVLPVPVYHPMIQQ